MMYCATLYFLCLIDPHINFCAILICQVPQLTNIEFDKQDKMIITGITQIRASPDAPTIENSFKLRARIGTRMNGQVIRLEDPEIAILLTLPKAWERK